MVQSKGATVENPPCEITQQQSQRYSHGGAERAVQTISNQIKTHRVKIEKNTGGLVRQLESAWFENMWLGRESENDERLIGKPNKRHGSKPCIETQSGKPTLGHCSIERHGLGPMESDTSHARDTTEGSQRPRTHLEGTEPKRHRKARQHNLPKNERV